MFIFTAKLRWGRIAAVLAAGLVLCFVLVGSARRLGPPATTASAVVSTQKLSNNEDRVAYLAGLGWQVDPDPIAVEELIVPKEFSDSYTNYLQLQADQGFDLTEYAGKRIKRYTYAVNNYPTGEKNVQVSLLMFRHRVIGGDVLSNQPGGFLHGLAMPEQSPS